MILDTFAEQIGAVVVLGVSGAAFKWGGAPERIAGWGVIAAWIASAAAINTRDWLSPQWVVAGIDLALLALLVFVALWSERTWALVASAFQLITVLVHIGRLIDRTFLGWTYISIMIACGYVVMAALAVGTWRHRRDRASSH